MGAKAIYIDKRKKIIHELILARNIDIIKGVLRDRNEYKRFASAWRAVNLDEFIAKFEIKSDTYNMQTNQRKISFFSDEKNYEIVAAIGGKYFRIQEIRANGMPGSYVDLDLKEPSIPGSFQGDARKAERQRLTHFRMSYRKGTV